MSSAKVDLSHVELNQRFAEALEVMERTDKSVFITGRAGTGKSTLLTWFRQTTSKRAVVLAPTGVAALNVKGQTIHSFFGFKPDITVDKIRKRKSTKLSVYQTVEAIVIDEISMVRADLLDCVDRFMRLNGRDETKPFGGVQMIFIGDLYQLPPVITGEERQAFQALYDTPYFYSARAFDDFAMEILELEKVYRQRDQGFLDILNAIRNNSITPEGLNLLNRRCLPDETPPTDAGYICLTTTNAAAGEINQTRLNGLRSRPHRFTAEISGKFSREYYPTAVELEVKTGAQVMLLNNDVRGRWVNGSIGRVTGIAKNDGDYVIHVELSDGQGVEVTPHTWEIFRFFVDGGQLQSEAAGSFTQYPLMLAWAVTIHKSQGKTFDRVIVDIGRGAFACGQTYVALSRCTTLEGMILKKPILKRHVMTDYRVMDFLTRYRYREAAALWPVDDKISRIEDAIENGSALRITYLKPSDEKSVRIIMPLEVGEMDYHGKSYLGVQAFCLSRRENRVFRVDRILELEAVSLPE
ncbi:MAG: AAA family ATPase [Dehalogenimonas sp.]|uniref:AAA family ATPase n=1 Tax=Candidatus Dehalogenimonas loeffleri TaxID=3127115 RepID=A0ABZ2J3Q6_9CHLR|nr:AAA family ATPase [Dehalogenimonas sp.]